MKRLQPSSACNFAVVLAVAVALAACASDDDGVTADESDGPVSSATSTTATSPAATDDTTIAPPASAATSTTTTTAFTAPANDDGLVVFDGGVDVGTSWRLPALGGMSIDIPEGHRVHHDGDMVLVRASWDLDAGRYLPSAVIALVSQAVGTGDPMTVEEFTTEAIMGVGTAEPTGTRIEFLGRELDGYRFEVAGGTAVGPHYVFAAIPRPAMSLTAWQPFPIAELFLADTPGGVLVVGAIGETGPDLAAAWAILGQVAPTVEVDELRTEPISPPIHPDPGEPPAPIERPDGMPPVLERVAQPIPPGDYVLDKLAAPVAVSLPENWWVQGNFPGLVVVTGDESFGPGDRAITFRTGLDLIVGVGSDFEAVTEPQPLDLARLAEQSDTLLVETSEVQVGGRNAVRVDIRVDPEADCSSSEPCEYKMLSSHFPLGESIRKGYVNRIWQISEGLPEPVTIIAVAADELWIDEAESVVDGLRFDS